MRTKQKRWVEVSAPARLHLGFLDFNGDLGRIHGSIGVAVERPRTRIRIEENDKQAIKDQKIQGLVEKFSQTYPLENNYRFEVKEKIPEHRGLGSGTQLSLALGKGLALLERLDLTTRDIARVFERGRMSGIGVLCFEKGQFVVDSGHDVDRRNEIPKELFRKRFPEEWRFLITIPEKEKGFHGKREQQALEKIDPSSQLSGEICRIALLKLLPSLVGKKQEAFGDALRMIDKKTGGFFKQAQSGIYKNKITEEIIQEMERIGISGAGQSSWGPTAYGLVREENAQEKLRQMKRYMQREKIKGKCFIAQVDNRGARVNSNFPQK